VAIPEPTPDELKALTERLTRAAATGEISIPRADREDVAQEAMLRLVRERPNPTPPPLVARGLRALSLAKIDYVRRKNRAKEPVLEVIENVEDLSREDAEMRLVELRQSICRDVDADALAVAEARAVGMTEAEIARQDGWTSERAHSAKRRLRRAQPRLRRSLLDD